MMIRFSDGRKAAAASPTAMRVPPSNIETRQLYRLTTLLAKIPAQTNKNLKINKIYVMKFIKT